MAYMLPIEPVFAEISSVYSTSTGPAYVSVPGRAKVEEIKRNGPGNSIVLIQNSGSRAGLKERAPPSRKDGDYRPSVPNAVASNQGKDGKAQQGVSEKQMLSIPEYFGVTGKVLD